MASPTFWSYFSPGVVSFIIYLFWTRQNAWSFWELINGNSRFVVTVIPKSPNVVRLVTIGLIAGVVITSTFPTWMVAFHSPHDDPWVLTHQRDASLYFIAAVLLRTITSFHARVKEENAKRVSLMVLAIFYVLFGSLLNAPANIPPRMNETSGWDHHSELQDAAHEVMMYLVMLPMALACAVEALFMSPRFWEATFVRTSFMLAQSVYWFFLAFAFGTSWCDNLDGPNSDRCGDEIMGVQIYQTRMVVPVIIALSFYINSKIWSATWPSAILMLILCVPIPRFEDPNNSALNALTRDDDRDEDDVDIGGADGLGASVPLTVPPTQPTHDIAEHSD